MHFTDTELEATGNTDDRDDAAVPQLSTLHTHVLVSDMDSSGNGASIATDLKAPSSGSEIFIKEVRSLPVTKKDHEAIEDNTMEVPQYSSDFLHREGSEQTLPLYKPAGVTDVPTQGGHITLLKEAEALTNILKANTSQSEQGKSKNLNEFLKMSQYDS